MSKGKGLLEQLGDKADGLLAHPSVQAAARAGRGLGLPDPQAEPAALAAQPPAVSKTGPLDRLLAHPSVRAAGKVRGSVSPTLGLAETEGPEASI